MSTVTFDPAANSAAAYASKAAGAAQPLSGKDVDALEKALGDTASISDLGRAMSQATQQVAAGKDPSQLSDAEKLEIRNTVQESLGLSDEQMAVLDKVNARMEAKRAQQGDPGPDADNQQSPSGQPSAEGTAAAGAGAGAGAGGGAGQSGSGSTDTDSQIERLEEQIKEVEQEIEELQAKASSDETAKEQLAAKQVELATLQAELAELETESSQAQGQAPA